MKSKNLFLILLMFLLCSILSLADNISDITKHLEATMRDKRELNFVLKYSENDKSLSTYTEDGKFIYRNKDIYNSDLAVFSDGVKIKISEKNGRLKPVIQANMPDGELFIKAEYEIKKPIDLKKIAKNGINMNLIENIELDNIVSAKMQTYLSSKVKSSSELKNRVSTTKIYSDSEKLEMYTVYKYGKTFTEGVMEVYSPYDELISTTTMKDGLPNGEMRVYQGPNLLKGIAHYKNGILDGEAVEYNEKGEVINRWFYKNGKEVNK